MHDNEYTMRDASSEESYPTVSGGVKSQKYYPTISFDVKQLPEISMWQVGGEYMLVLKVKQTSYNQSKYMGKTEERATFEVREVGSMHNEAKMTDSMVSKKLGYK